MKPIARTILVSSLAREVRENAKGEAFMELEDRIVAFAARCVKVCAALPVKNVGSAEEISRIFGASVSTARKRICKH